MSYDVYLYTCTCIYVLFRFPSYYFILHTVFVKII